MNKLVSVAKRFFGKTETGGETIKKNITNSLKLSILGPILAPLLLVFIIFLVIVSMFGEKVNLLQMVDPGSSNVSSGVNFSGGKGSLTAEQRKKIIEFAESQLGVPYNYGARGTCGGGAWENDIPGVSLSCNGLVRHAYAAAGISVPVGSIDQISQAPVVTSTGLVSDMTPGDVIVYDDAGYRSDIQFNRTSFRHVAIYIGNGELIEGTCPSVQQRAIADNGYSYSVTW